MTVTYGRAEYHDNVIMESSTVDNDDSLPIFYVAHHQSRRDYSVGAEVIQQAHNCNYDLVTTYITTNIFETRVKEILSEANNRHNTARNDIHPSRIIIPSIRPADTFLRPAQHVSQLLAFTSSWIDLTSSDPLFADASLQVLKLEIAHAAFCGITNIVIASPATGKDAIKFAFAIRHSLTLSPHVQLHILVSFDSRCQVGEDEEHGSTLTTSIHDYNCANSVSQEKPQLSSWIFWNTIRSVCKYSSRLSVALCLPEASSADHIRSRWFSEPIRILYILGESFLRNAKGYPVLSRANQTLIATYMRLKPLPWIILADVGPIPGLYATRSHSGRYMSSLSSVTPISTEGRQSSTSPTPSEAAASQQSSRQKARDPTPHLSYIRHLQRNQPQKPAIEMFGAGYQDYLQAPLQPLTTDLESITYEVFETDPIKYDWYQRAIEFALRDWSMHSKSTSSSDGSVVFAVVGSGRGPLVTRVLNSSRATGVKVKVYAIEKNPNACVILEQHNHDDWDNTVSIMNTDMRSWTGPEKNDLLNGRVDILVSELLGSFGDNELSPECLDGAQKVLNPIDGISIPARYSSFLTPIASPRLHAEISLRALSDKEAFETPYVVMLHSYDFLSKNVDSANAIGMTDSSRSSETKDPEPHILHVWSFAHPNPAMNKQGNLCDTGNGHNSRYAELKYDCEYRGVCHGLAGYFEALLYQGNSGTVELSTNPSSMKDKSKDMISWFPIFFPLKTPLSIPNRSMLNVYMWRQTDNKKVWYEWMVETFIKSVNGDQSIGLSDLHSNAESGCLM